MRLHVRICGFSLVEVTLALGVMAVCLIAVFGLLPTGMNSNQAAIQQTATSAILTMISEDLHSTPKNANSSLRLNIPIPGGTGGTTLYFTETGNPDTQANSRYRASVIFTPSTNRLATTGKILITWPAQQDDTSKATGSTEAFIALDRN
jgi:uncharacterized protein (TIGR02598 family)